MTQAKAPDNERDWEYIDIFLFTNGQQYSPPRKHHLRSDDLNRWDATLSQLAKTQFGSMHSALQLYTLDGRRVENPLELSNGATYVAVEPPDAFIDTGYDKYIIRATRSWERRQTRKSSNEMPTDATPIMVEDQKTYVNVSDVMSIKPPQEDFREQSVTNPSIKSPNVFKIQKQAQKSPPITKQTDRRRASLTQRVTSFKKVTNPPPLAAVNKLVAKTSPPKKINKPPIRTSNTLQANFSAKSRVNTKTVLKPKENVATDPSKVIDRESTSLTRVSKNYKMMTTDGTPMENIIGDKELILVSNLYKNPDSDIKSLKTDSTVKKEQVGVQYSPEMITIDEEIQSVINETRETAQGPVSIQEQDVKNSKIIIVNITTDCQNLFPTHPVDNNYIAFTNKDDVLNLRLMIEVRNVDNRNGKYKIVQKSQSGTHILNPHKESENNIDDEVFIQSKSLHSVLENELCHNVHAVDNPKVVVVRCGCRQLEQENDMSCVYTSSTHTYNKRYFILVPKREESEMEEDDRCKNTKQNTDKCEQLKQESEQSSSMAPAKQTFSEDLVDRTLEPKNTKCNSRSRDAESPISEKRSIPPQADYRSYVGNDISENRIKSKDIDHKPKSTDLEAPISYDNSISPHADYNKNFRNDTNSEHEIEDKKAQHVPSSTDIRKPISNHKSIPSQTNYDTNIHNGTNSEYEIECKNMEENPRGNDLEAPISNNNSIPRQADYDTNTRSDINSEYCSECATVEFVDSNQKEVATEDQTSESGATTCKRSSVVSEKTEYVVRRKSSLKEQKTYVDNWTQTDTSDILLEARRDSDGRYTFHLPSLYMLKHYQL